LSADGRHQLVLTDVPDVGPCYVCVLCAAQQTIAATAAPAPRDPEER
jgi:hypothetical protein